MYHRQVGGAVKNVIAIAAGMCEGLGLGASLCHIQSHGILSFKWVETTAQRASCTSERQLRTFLRVECPLVQFQSKKLSSYAQPARGKSRSFTCTGTNAMAALVTRGCAEMRRLVVSLGGEVRMHVQ